MTPMYAVTESYSGRLGETAVLAALLRQGFPVAQPTWGEDEWDLLILDRSEQSWPVALPVQVKSRQEFFTARTSGHSYVYVKGLKKKYVVRNPELCLAVYFPQDGSTWLLVGSPAIIKAHGAAKFAALKPNQDLRLRVLRDGKPTLPRTRRLGKKPAPLRSQILRLAAAQRTRIRKQVMLDRALRR